MRNISDDTLIEMESGKCRPAFFAKLTFAPPTGTNIYDDNVLLNGDFLAPGDAGSLGADWTRVETDNTRVIGIYEQNGSYDTSPDLLLRVQESATFSQEEYARAFSSLHPVTPGDVLRVGGYVSAASSGGATVPANCTIIARLGVLFLDSTENYLASNNEVSAGDDIFTAGQAVTLSWSNREVTATVPAGAAYVQFECSLFVIPDAGTTPTTSSAGLTADVRFDSLYLQKQYNPDVRVWSGVGPISYGGFQFIGVGNLGSISPVVETTETQAQGITLQLTGIPKDLLHDSMTHLNAGGVMNLHMGFLDPNGLLIDTPIMVYSGLMDQVSVKMGPKTATITIAVENRLSQLQRSRGWLYTDQAQRQISSDDDGLKWVAVTSDVFIKWN
jgi:hypothetical protein